MSQLNEQAFAQLKRSFEEIGRGMQKAIDDATAGLNRFARDANQAFENARKMRQQRDRD